MGNFRVWIETTKKGSFLVRHEDAQGNRKTDYCVEKYESTFINGKELKGKTLANALRDKVKDIYLQTEMGSFDTALLLSELAKTYLKDLETNNYSAKTVMHYKQSLDPFLGEANLKTTGDLMERADSKTFAATQKIKNWKFDMVNRGLSNNTIRNRLGDIRTFLNWLKANGKIAVSPFGLKMLPQKLDSEPKYYTTEEFKALDDALLKISLPARILCQLAHSAGLRKTEALNVRWEDITWHRDDTAELLVRREVGKGKRRSRTLPLDPGVLEAMGPRKTGFIVAIRNRFSIDHYFQRARKMAKINPDLDIHGLRHTFAKNYLQKGEGNLASLKVLMGHSSIVSTQIYSQLEKSYLAEGIKRAYERRLQDEALSQRLKVV